MSRFMTNPAVINDQFDTICENAYVSIAAAVDDEPMEVATEGFKDTVKEAFTKVCDTIMKWIRKIIEVFKNVKKWIVDHAKLIIAKFKGKQEVELNDTNKMAAAVNELKKEAKEAIAEMKEDAEEAKKEEKAADSGAAVEPEVLDDKKPPVTDSPEIRIASDRIIIGGKKVPIHLIREREVILYSSVRVLVIQNRPHLLS